VFRRDEMEFTPPSRGDQNRRLMRLSNQLQSTRANVWVMPPGTQGRRHREPEQEELFIALEGNLTLLIGEPGELISVPQSSIVVVAPHTAVQLLNSDSQSAVVLIVGAPPSSAPAEYLDEA
jgi:quercetin dioxygenase-like cupin family protein